jgi:hypothetical protein
MPGALAWGYYPTTKVWLPIQVDSVGRLKADMSAINLGDLADVDLTGLADDDFMYYDLASGLWKPRKLVDADIPATICRDSELADHAALSDVHHATHLKILADHPLTIIPTMDDDHIPATIARDAEVATAVSDHAALTTGAHGVGANYIPAAPAASHLVRAFTKGWTADKFLKGGGVDANPVETDLLWTPALYTTQIPWVSLNGFTQTLPAGSSIAIGVWALVIFTGATINNNCGLYSTYGFNAPFPAGKETAIEFPLSTISSIANQRAIMFFINNTAYPPTETLAHVGFIISNGDLYSSSADGTTQETQDTGIDIVAAAQLTFCKAVVIPGTSVKFYVNNVLKTTHTTKVPPASTPWCVLNLGLKTLAAANIYIGIERIIITKEM